jgi:hypothetical protein
MIRQDYLLRLIEQLGVFFRRALAGESSGSSDELTTQLEQLTDEVIGLPGELVLTLPVDDLVSLFELSDRMVIEKCFLAGEINRIRAKLETGIESKTFHTDRAVFFFDIALPNLTGELKERTHKRLTDLTTERTN